MPFINIKINTAVSAENMDTIKSALGQAVKAIPGKSENWLMVGIEPEYALWFKGSNAPAAMAEVSLYGDAPSSSFSKLTGSITQILGDTLNIAPDRIYVKYSCTDDWGWNVSNF